MWKFLRYTIYLSATIAIFMAAYNIRMYVYVPHIEKVIYSKTGHKVGIDNFYISPLKSGVAFVNVSIDGKVQADKVIVKISLKKIFKNLTNPVNYISDIEFSNVSADLDAFKNNTPASGEPSKSEPSNSISSFFQSEIRLSADNIIVKSGKESIKIINAEAALNNKELLLSFTGMPFQIPFYVNGVVKLDEINNLMNTDFTIVSDAFIESIISVSGTVNASDFSVIQNVFVEKFRSDYFEISDSSGTLTKDENGLRGAFGGDFGNFSFETEETGTLTAKAEMSLSKINSEISAEVKSDFIYKDGEGTLNLSLKDTFVYGFGLGSFQFSGIRQNSGDYDIFCDYGKTGKIYYTYKSGGIYNLKITSEDKVIGTVSGNIRTGEVDADIDNVPVSKFPIVQDLKEKTSGTLTINGSLSETSGLINFSLKDLETPKIGKTDILGTVTRSSDIYVFYFYKSDKSLVFNSVTKSGELLSTDFKFVNADITNILRAFGYTKVNFSGNASGRVQYEKEGTTSFDVKAYDGSFFDNQYKVLEAKGDVNLERININKFYLKGADEQVNAFAEGLIGFTNINPVSSLNLRMRKINIGGVSVDSDIILNGQLNSKNEVLSTISGNSIKVSGVSFNNLNADAVISYNKFILSNIRSENGFEGNLSCLSDEGDWKLSGLLHLKNTNITGAYRGLEAYVNSTIKISGNVDKPEVNMSVSVKTGKYLDIPFTFNSEVSYANDSFRVKNAELVSSKAKLSVNGKYSQAQKGQLAVEFENVNELIINTFVGFRTPFIGNFSGTGTLYQYEKAKSRLKMDIASKRAYIKKVKLDNIKSKIEISGNKILISSATARLADSEIRADSGAFNIKTGKYDLSLFLVNTHLGPVDVFGRVNINGKMDKKRGGSIYKGKIDVKNLWINKYRLASFDFDYTIKNKKFSLYRSSGPITASGSVDFTDHVKIEDLNISQSSSSAVLNAFFEDDKFNFAAEGKNIDLEFLSEVIDSSIDAAGKFDFSIDASGPYLSPKIKFLVKSNKGSIMEVPYDDINFEILSSDNKAEIKNARIYRKNEIDIGINGSFPFWIDDSLTKKMKDMPVDVTYEANDSKLYLLKYLSGGEVRPKSGKIHVKGRIEGTTNKISNSGRFQVSNGVFDSKTYFDRMKDFNADIVWDDNSVVINKLSGKSGSGRLTVSGGLVLDGFNIQSFNILANTDNKGIPIKVPQLPMQDSVLSRGILQEYSSGEPRFNLKLEGTPAKPKISGWISLENTRFCFPPPDDFGEDDIFPDATEFDIELRTAKNTKFENSFADAWINGSLFIKGTYEFMKPYGIIETQRGSIKYLGIVFDILNAKIEIIDDETLFVSGEAETNVYSPGSSDPETIVLSIARSTFDNLNVRFYSRDDPTMDSQTALARVTKTEQTVSRNSNNQELILGVISDFDLRQQALRLIDSSFATPFARNVLRRTGIADNFKVSYVNSDQQLSSSDDTTFADLLYGTKYSVEKNITNQFLLGYSITFDQIQRKLDLRHEVEMRYRLHNNLFLSGSYELESEDSLHEPDRRLMLQHQIRFGLPSNKRTKGARSGND